MYRIYKPNGVRPSISVTNTATGSSISIGVVNNKITEILTEHGYTFPAWTDEWSIEVDQKTAQDLIVLTTMKIKKPVRSKTQVNKKEEKNTSSQNSPDVDIFDMIFE